MPYNPQLALLYGRFVQAAYTMYQNDPKNLTPAPSVDFPAGYELTAWIQMQDFFIFGSTGLVFYGFIAHSARDPNLAILAIRGTDNNLEWWDDVNSLGMAPFRVPNCGNVGLGWEKIYETLEVVERPPAAVGGAPRSLKAVGGFSAQVAEHIARQAALSGAAPSPAAHTIEVVGHSLGAALATLYAAETALTHKIPTIDALYTLASPKIGDQTFVDKFNSLQLNSWRILNQQDIVGALPFWPPTYQHVNSEVPYDSRGKVSQLLACCHALSSYLHLIDATYPLSAGCQPAPQLA